MITVEQSTQHPFLHDQLVGARDHQRVPPSVVRYDAQSRRSAVVIRPQPCKGWLRFRSRSTRQQIQIPTRLSRSIPPFWERPVEHALHRSVQISLSAAHTRHPWRFSILNTAADTPANRIILPSHTGAPPLSLPRIISIRRSSTESWALGGYAGGDTYCLGALACKNRSNKPPSFCFFNAYHMPLINCSDSESSRSSTRRPLH